MALHRLPRQRASDGGVVDRYEDRTQAEVEAERRLEHEAREHEWFREQVLDGTRYSTQGEDEWLGIVPEGKLMHAAFPSASRTLCQTKRESGEFWPVDIKRHQVKHPNCRRCLAVLSAWMGEVARGHRMTGIPLAWRNAHRKAAA